MDKNSISGLIIIALILVGYSYFMSPSKEELREMHVRDSIARVEAQRLAAIEKQQKEDFALSQQDSSSKTETIKSNSTSIVKEDESLTSI